MEGFVLLVRGQEGLVCALRSEETEKALREGYTIKSKTTTETRDSALSDFKFLYPSYSM
jgi:hypothetical protein